MIKFRPIISLKNRPAIFSYRLLFALSLLFGQQLSVAQAGISQSSAAEEEKTLMLKIEYVNESYEVMDAWLVAGKLPERKSVNSNGEDLVFTLENKQGDLLGQGRMTNPAILRGVLAEKYDGVAHSEERQPQAIFILRYPYSEGMQILSLMKAQDLLQQFSSTGDAALAPVNAIKLDFSQQL